jgi:hypothetical protein
MDKLDSGLNSLPLSPTWFTSMRPMSTLLAQFTSRTHTHSHRLVGPTIQPSAQLSPTQRCSADRELYRAHARSLLHCRVGPLVGPSSPQARAPRDRTPRNSRRGPGPLLSDPISRGCWDVSASIGDIKVWASPLESHAAAMVPYG